ncbi:MAG: sigma-70 family RNA polymerase sigma factor [Frankiales bacterium]|nr:sigma-70 family RNA polymerase sigma factor [Frankiales bacterium]
MRAELEFDSFYARTRPRLLQQLTLVTLDREQAADALQDAYIRAWQQWDRIAEYDDPESWVRTVAYRRCVSHWRRLVTARRAAPRVAVDDVVAPVGTAEVVAVRQALAALSPEHRAVLVLHELCDLGVEEIAASLRVPRGTVKSRLARARTALARLLAEPPDPPPRPAPGAPAPVPPSATDPSRARPTAVPAVARIEVPDVLHP